MIRYLILIILFPFIVFAQEEAAQEIERPPETIPFAYLVLDASSSMWGRIDERPKIELAKEVLTKIINGLPKKVNTGFTVYGHRKKDDCADIEDISPIGIMDKSDVISKLKKITPKGKSPLTAALRHVTELMKDYVGPKTIILVSDGVESCGQDACSFVKELKAQDADFKIEVIGLNLTDDETKQLNCLAELSGGSYQYINTAAQVNTVVPSTPTPYPTIPAVIYAPTATSVPFIPTPQGLTIVNRVPTPMSAVLERGKGSLTFEHENWLFNPFYWRLIDLNSGDEIRRSRNFEEYNIPEGIYVLAWRQYEHGSTEVIVDRQVVIKPDTVTTVTLNTAMRLQVPAWVRPPRFWGLQDTESGEQIATFTPFETFLVPPGEYDLIWRQYENRSDTISFGHVEIEYGKTNEFPIRSSITPQLAEWVNTEPYFWGLRIPESKEYKARFYGSVQPQLIPEGRYDVVYRLTANDSSDSILGEVTISNDENSDFIIDSGVQFELKDPSNMPQSIELSELDAKDETISTVRLAKNLGPLPLKPGKYSINYIRGPHAAGKQAGADTVVIKQGELLKINLDDLFHATSVAAQPVATIVPTSAPIEIITPIVQKESSFLPDSQAGASVTGSSSPNPELLQD